MRRLALLVAWLALCLASPSFAQTKNVPTAGTIYNGPATPIFCVDPATGNISACSSGGGNVTITGPVGRQADALSVSSALSTEDVAALTPATTSGTPCATATTAGCTGPDTGAAILTQVLQIATNTAVGQLPSGNVAIYPVPQPSGGTTIFSNTAVTNTAVSVKATAGQLFAGSLANPSNATACLQIYNVASGSVTVGTTAPAEVFCAASGSSALYPSDFYGAAYSSQISVACTTTPTGGSAPSTACVVSLHYK